ncbi:hypothetical protein L6452_18060 [Arctium lappa]|uniref:Uncharacterized protein n=1 Tax=Arctium lappa TaxID=4217 RepID=A0ACB9C595_ARCLA|nr:hypothetical protein L6452_18060 [Arctium lappa]
MENKLEPERKLKLAQELGLQPRQVVSGFRTAVQDGRPSNSRETMFFLKPNLIHSKTTTIPLKIINLYSNRELKSKLYSKDQETDVSVKEETDDKPKSPETMYENMVAMTMTYFLNFKDGSLDNDSSAILNEDNNNSNMVVAVVINCH